jgi:hypothetical protein
MVPHASPTPRPLSFVSRVSAIAALLLLALVPVPARPVSAHEAPLPTTAADPSAAAKARQGDTELEGTLEILHEHLQDGSSQERHVLQMSDGSTVKLQGLPPGRDLLTGDRVRVRGASAGKTLQLDAAAAQPLQVLQYAPLNNTFGVQKVLVLLVNLANDPRQPYTIEQARASLAVTDAFFQENSYGQTSLEFDLHGWYTLPINATACTYTAVRTYALQAAIAKGINLSSYTRYLFLVPATAGCGFTGLGTIGGNPSSAWVQGNKLLNLFHAHELAHGFGLYHSHSLRCAPGVVLGPSCTLLEYGNSTDMMGGAPGHFNAFQKQRLGWLGYGASPSITTVENSGVYTIDTYAGPGTGPKALKIARGLGSESFFVEFRRNDQGFDTAIFRSGVFVHLASDTNPNSSVLLDMVPETLSWFSDTALEVGQSFTDPTSGVTLTTLAVSSTSATIMVSMDSAASPCTRSAPRVSASPGQSLIVPAGTAVTYTVSVTNTDSAACAAASFTLQATAPTGWQKSFGASSVTAHPGATVSTTLRITSPLVATGSYAIVSTATSTSASPLSGAASVLYNVAPDGPVSPPSSGSFTDNFDRPAAPVMGNGWSVVTGNLMLQAGEARNLSTSLFSLAVQPTLIGATQTVAASFASTNNNSAPRFGVVVRYRDPQNYYLCARQVGGSSTIRIAKVQNGVETVLKSVGIGNPALNAFSKLSCQVSGTTLTLAVDGVTKLFTNDGTFSTGSAGYVISAKAGTHRVDNFSAIVQ